MEHELSPPVRDVFQHVTGVLIGLDEHIAHELAADTVGNGSSHLVAISPHQQPFILRTEYSDVGAISQVIRPQSGDSDPGEPEFYEILGEVLTQKLENLSVAMTQTARGVSERLLSGSNETLGDTYEYLIDRQEAIIIPTSLDLDRFTSALAGHTQYLGVHSEIRSEHTGTNPYFASRLKNSPHLMSAHVHKLKGTANSLMQVKLSTLKLLVERKPDISYERVLRMIVGNTTRSLQIRATEPETDHSERVRVTLQTLTTALLRSYHSSLMTILTHEIGDDRKLSLAQLRQIVGELSRPYESFVQFDEGIKGATEDSANLDRLQFHFPLGHEQIVIQEIIQNAIDHSSETGKAIRIEYEYDPTYANGQGSLHVSFIDNGKGMDPSHIEHFNKYGVLPNEALSSRFGSTGTGLFRIRQELAEMGGWMYLKPGAQGRGLAVCMHLPVANG